MPEAERREKNYYDVSGCGANIAWHTENDTLEIADRDILLADMKIYLLSALRIANAEVLPFDWPATCDEFLATIARYEKASQGMARSVGGARGDGKVEGGAWPVGQRAGGNEECGAARAGADPGADQLHAGAALPARSGLHGAAAADARGGGRAARPAGALRKPAQVELMRGQNRYLAAIEAATRLVG